MGQHDGAPPPAADGARQAQLDLGGFHLATDHDEPGLDHLPSPRPTGSYYATTQFNCGPGRSQPAGMGTYAGCPSLRRLVEQPPRLLQIGRLEALGEPIV